MTLEDQFNYYEIQPLDKTRKKVYNVPSKRLPNGFRNLAITAHFMDAADRLRRMDRRVSDGARDNI